MNPWQLKRLFPGASAATIAANAGDYGTAELLKQAAEMPDVTMDRSTGKIEVPKLRHRRRVCNKTESLMFARLVEQYDFDTVHFEAITLRWGGTPEARAMAYTPDFLVFTEPKWTLIEVKGAHERSRDIVRFRGCRAEWQDRFNFEYWMLKKGAWTRLE